MFEEHKSGGIRFASELVIRLAVLCLIFQFMKISLHVLRL